MGYSAIGKDEVGKNLFDKNSIIGYCFEGNGIIGTIGRQYYGIKVGKGLGQVYASAINPNGRDIYYYLVALKDNGDRRIPLQYFITPNSTNKGTFYIEEDETLWLYDAGVTSNVFRYINETNIQIEKGTQATPYEPYKITGIQYSPMNGNNEREAN